MDKKIRHFTQSSEYVKLKNVRKLIKFSRIAMMTEIKFRDIALYIKPDEDIKISNMKPK